MMAVKMTQHFSSVKAAAPACMEYEWSTFKHWHAAVWYSMDPKMLCYVTVIEILKFTNCIIFLKSSKNNVTIRTNINYWQLHCNINSHDMIFFNKLNAAIMKKYK